MCSAHSGNSKNVLALDYLSSVASEVKKNGEQNPDEEMNISNSAMSERLAQNKGRKETVCYTVTLGLTLFLMLLVSVSCAFER